jgi:hypothetical protein
MFVFFTKSEAKTSFLEIQHNNWVGKFHLDSSEGAEFKY